MLRVYEIHSNFARLYNFFFYMMDYGENGYLYSKMWRGGALVGIKMSWVEKNRKINNRGGGGDYSGHASSR